jgi:hypothetical protein
MDFADYPIPAGRPNCTPSRARRALTRRPWVSLRAGALGVDGLRGRCRFGETTMLFRRLAGLPVGVS